MGRNIELTLNNDNCIYRAFVVGLYTGVVRIIFHDLQICKYREHEERFSGNTIMTINLCETFGYEQFKFLTYFFLLLNY